MSLLLLLLSSQAPAQETVDELAWIGRASPETWRTFGRLATEELYWTDVLLDSLEEEARLRFQQGRLQCLVEAHARHEGLQSVARDAVDQLEEHPEAVEEGRQEVARVALALREVRLLRVRAEEVCPRMDEDDDWVRGLASGEVVVQVVSAPCGEVWETDDWAGRVSYH